jgi:hypothetical protein
VKGRKTGTKTEIITRKKERRKIKYRKISEKTKKKKLENISKKIEYANII